MRQESNCERVKFSGSGASNRQIVSLIDTVRYINWPRKLILIYIHFVGGFAGIERRVD
jgi:hypothetical protein